jgi:hypothetical protein
VKVTAGTLVSTVNARVAHSPGPSTASLARTARVCAPSSRDDVVWGDSHGAGVTPSSAHSVVAAGSEGVKEKVGVESFVGVGSAGPDWKLTLGAAPAPPPVCASAVAPGAPAANSAATDAARIDRP